MQHASSYSPCQRFLATLLLCSLLLQSCGYSNFELYNASPASEPPGRGTAKQSTQQAADPSNKLCGEGPGKPPLEDSTWVFPASAGQSVKFRREGGQWQASLTERPKGPVKKLPVACERHGDVAEALAALQDKPPQYTQRRIHVMYTKQPPYEPQFVYLGAQGLSGGGNGADEPSGSDASMSEAPAGGQEASKGPGEAVSAEAAPVLAPLLAALQNSNSNVSSATCYVLGKLVQATPALAAQVLEPLLAAMRGPKYVSSAACYALGEVVQAAPGQAAEVLEPLLAALQNSDFSVSSAASYALGEVLQAAPALAAQVLAPLLAALQNPDFSVSSAASSALGEVVQAAPDKAAQVLAPLLKALRDLSPDVREAARSALAAVAQAAPALASQVLAPLLAACKDSDDHVREAARKALVQVVQAASDKAE